MRYRSRWKAGYGTQPGTDPKPRNAKWYNPPLPTSQVLCVKCGQGSSRGTLYKIGDNQYMHEHTKLDRKTRLLNA